MLHASLPGVRVVSTARGVTSKPVRVLCVGTLLLAAAISCKDSSEPTNAKATPQFMTQADSLAFLQGRRVQESGESGLVQATAGSGIAIDSGEIVTVTIVSAECSGVGDVLEVHGPVSGVVSTDACVELASRTFGPSPGDGELTFTLTDQRFGSGTFRVSGSFPSYTVEMEDGFGDGDFNDNVLSVVFEEPPCPPTGDPVLDDPGVRGGMSNLMTQSNPDAPNQADRVEKAGLIYRRPDGSVYLQPFVTQAPDNCGFEWGIIQPLVGSDVLIGRFHTHPYVPGEMVVACGQTALDPPVGTDYPRFGGAPLRDWEELRAFNDRLQSQGFPPVRDMVMDKNGVSLLDPSVTAPGSERSNPFQFSHARCTW